MTKKIKETKSVKEAIYDPGNTVPVRGVEPGGDDPMLAVKELEPNKLGPDDTIINSFTQSEKKQLLQMIKKGEFSQLEAAVLRALMSEGATLEDVGAMIGAKSRRTHGAPTSKPAAIKEINRILQIVAKRSKAMYGKEADLSQIKKYKQEMKRVTAWRMKKAKEAQKYARNVEKEFYQLLKELHQAEDAAGVERSKYYIKKFAPRDADISKIAKFGGTPDYQD